MPIANEQEKPIQVTWSLGSGWASSGLADRRHTSELCGVRLLWCTWSHGPGGLEGSMYWGRTKVEHRFRREQGKPWLHSHLCEREALATGRNRRLARLKWCWPRMAALCVLESGLWQTLANHWATWHRPDSQESQLTRDPGKVSRHCCWTLWGRDRTHFSKSLDKKQEQTKQTKNKNNFLGWGRSDNIRIQLFQ